MNACNHRRTQYGVMRDNGERGQAAKHLQTLNLESGQFTYPILAAGAGGSHKQRGKFRPGDLYAVLGFNFLPPA